MGKFWSIFLHNKMICIFYSILVCSPIPPVSNAIVPPVAAVGEHVGKEYLYACDTGYVVGGLSYPFIKCRETNRVSLWDSIPQCISKLTLWF